MRAARAVFAARAGARHVYAVEASALAEQTRAVIAANGLSSVITVLQCKSEEAELPEQVDVIVSEWMGYALLYENMLGSVLAARDKWLRPGGLMMPSHATIWCAPVTDEDRYDDAVRFWDDVHGIDMRVLAPAALKCAFAEPVVESFPPQGVMTWPVPLRRLDLATIAAADVLPWEGRFEAASLGCAPCHGLAVWFDVEFHSSASAKAAAALPAQPLGRGAPARVPPAEAAPRVRLGTGPDDPATHWMTTLLYVEQPRPTQQDGRICGALRMAPHAANERFLTLTLSFDAADDGSAPAVEKTFHMV
jgi:protein arginine N-methyltransferase 6